MHMKELDCQITEAKEKILQLENRHKRLLSRINNEEHRARTHRLIERALFWKASMMERRS